MSSDLIERGNFNTGRFGPTGRMPCEDEGRNWGDASTSQRRPSKPPEAKGEA